jgi:hypothetical protein
VDTVVLDGYAHDLRQEPVSLGRRTRELRDESPVPCGDVRRSDVGERYLAKER